jgi:hypothetical protein
MMALRSAARRRVRVSGQVSQGAASEPGKTHMHGGTLPSERMMRLIRTRQSAMQV